MKVYLPTYVSQVILEYYRFFIATRFELKKKVGVVGESEEGLGRLEDYAQISK